MSLFNLSLPNRYVAVCVSCFTLLLIYGCGSPTLLPPPPQAEVGDASVTVTVKAKGRRDFPQGAQVVVSLVDMSLENRGEDNNTSFALAGDSLSLSQPDQGVRITFPADKHKIAPCVKRRTCAFLVQVVQNGRVLFANTAPVFYTSGQKRVTVWVERTV